MSIFRIEKNKNYTAMSNYHFQDMNLSLKAIGLLSKMLSLPDNWDYSQAGLAKICKDGEDSIGSALKELEKFGYLVRERTRGPNGRMGGMIYHVYEVPKHLLEKSSEPPAPPARNAKAGQGRKGRAKTSSAAAEEEGELQAPEEPHQNTSPRGGLPGRENPVMVNPVVVNPDMEVPVQVFPEQEVPGQGFPTQGFQPQINNNILITNQESTDEVITDGQITFGQNTKTKNNQKNIYSINPSIPEEPTYTKPARADGLIDGQKRVSFDFFEEIKQQVKEQISYDYFVYTFQSLNERLEDDTIDFDDFEEQIKSCKIRTLDQVVGYMVDVLASQSREPIRIGYEFMDREIVKAKLRQDDRFKVREVIKQLNSADIKNPKGYAISMLYNS